MPRKTPIIKIQPEDKATLLRWASIRTLPNQTVERAKLILDCETGKSVKLIAQELNTYPNKIIYWRQSYLAKELDASVDAVWKVLPKEGITLQRQRSWCISTDKNLPVKLRILLGFTWTLPLMPLSYAVMKNQAFKHWSGKLAL